GQVDAAADVRGVERVGQRVVEGAVGGQAQPGDDALQRQAVPLLAGVLAEKDLLQIIPDGGMALVQVAYKQVLLEDRHVVQAPLGKFGVGAAPLHEPAQPLQDGLAPVQVGLGQAGDLGDVVLQFAEDAGAQMDRKGVQDVAVFVDL